MAKNKITEFKRIVWRQYRINGRHNLPWRKTKDPYKILVAEVMLQQTQVERVVPLYTAFIKRFPTAKKLAQAPLSSVLRAWQGLGYNRRAKMLHTAAKKLVARRTYSVTELEALPGVGPYTARAVVAFAFNRDVVFVETNIRTAVIHHFFQKKKKVSDAEILKILRRAAPDVASAKSGEWYSALMDYGASLKRSGISYNAQSRQYARQTTFAGSLREARGAILRSLAYGSASSSLLIGLFGPSRRAQMRTALHALFAEGLIEKKGSQYALAE